jgi:hypothetical protein
VNGSDKLIDAAELADLLGVPIGWVRSHTRSKAIPHVRLGRYDWRCTAIAMQRLGVNKYRAEREAKRLYEVES